ncbi:hypothetical protein BJ912DRAFT_691780 [Pholiota molesta]|nr:hypothetical protein BJ912DRAFT_691780 [Pholiota molesta]
MIGNSPLDYIGIRIGIGALRAIAPASIGYLVCCAVWPKCFLLPVAVVAAAEAVFYLFVYLPRTARLQSTQAPSLTFEQRQLVFQRCMAAEKSLPSTDLLYPRGWFIPKNIPPRRDDVIDWLLWALFSSSKEEIDLDDYREELEGYLREIEKYHDQPLAPGRSQKDQLQSMRITLDPVVMLHRPLIWYMIVALVDSYTSISLACLGFKHYTPVEGNWRRTFPPRPILYLLSNSAPPGVVTPYWHRPHTSNSKLPIVFLHGIGIGLFPYLNFFRSIISGSDSDVGILLPEMMSICMHMTPRSVPPREEMLASLNIILESLQAQDNKERELRKTPSIADDHSPLLNNLNHANVPNPGWDRVVLTAHSYGTFVAGWIVRACVESSLDTINNTATAQSTAAKSLTAKLAHLVLVDPIPILLSNPAVAYNFLYRHPSTVPPPPQDHAIDPETPLTSSPSSSTSSLHELAPNPSWISSAAAWQLWYFASRDADVARTLFRAFFWDEGGIWREDLVAFVGGDQHPANTDRSTARNLAVVLGGMDQVVPSDAIRHYITREAEWKAHWIGRAEGAGGDLVALETQEVPDESESEVVAMLARVSSSRSAGPKNGRQTPVKQGVLEVLFNPRLDHAVIFDDPKWTSPLLEVVQRYTRDRS